MTAAVHAAKVEGIKSFSLEKNKIASPRVEEEAAETFSSRATRKKHCGKLRRKLSLKTSCFLLAGGRISAGKNNYAVRPQAVHMSGLKNRVDAVLLV